MNKGNKAQSPNLAASKGGAPSQKATNATNTKKKKWGKGSDSTESDDPNKPKKKNLQPFEFLCITRAYVGTQTTADGDGTSDEHVLGVSQKGPQSAATMESRMIPAWRAQIHVLMSVLAPQVTALQFSRSQVVLIRFVFSRPRSQVRAVSFVRVTHALRSVPFHVHGFRLVLSASYTQVRTLDSHFQFVLSIHALNFVLSEMCFWCSADSFYQVWALSFVRSSSCSQVCLLYVVS